MKNNVSTFFYLKKPKNYASGTVPIYMRITVDGERNHNHPSSNLKPSQSDLTLTRRLVEAGKLLDLQVLDHIILTKRGYFSFGDEGLM